MAFVAVAGVLFSSLKVNFQTLFSVANVLQTPATAKDCQRPLSIELLELQRLAVVRDGVELPKIEHNLWEQRHCLRDSEIPSMDRVFPLILE